MAKLYFRYGAMGSGKTRDLIKIYYNYKEKDMTSLIIKPKIDTKGDNTILSRDKGSLIVDYLIKETDNIYDIVKKHILINKIHCVLVEEAQFLSEANIDELAQIVDELDIPVICYGIRTDFKNKLFIGSKRLFEIADTIEEIKTVCKCGKKATCNARFVNGKSSFEGDQVLIDDKNDVKYISYCRKCYNNLKSNVKK